MTGYDGRGAQFPITIPRGSDVAFTVTATDSVGAAISLAGATITGNVYTTAGTVAVAMTDAVSGAGNNIITLSLTDTQTTALTATAYRWALTVTRGTDTRYWLAGPVTMVDVSAGRTSNGANATLVVDEDVNVTVTVAALGAGGAGTGDLLSTNNLSDVANAATARSNLGLAIGTNVQAYDADLADIAAISDVQGDILVRGASGWERLAKSATSTDVLTAGATQPAWAAPTGGGATNLSWTAATSVVASDTGTDATLTAVDASNPGLMTVAMKTKLDGIEAAADVTDATNVAAAGAVMATLVDAKGDLIVATAADTVARVAVGGTNGHVLTVDSAEASGVKWAAAGSGAVATDAIWDAKGDLAIGTGANTASKLVVGANSTVLLADSGEATGVRWASVGAQIPGAAGRYYMGVLSGSNPVNSAGFIANQLVGALIYVPTEISIDRLAVNVNTNVASATLRLGIYLPDATGGMPGTLVVAGSGTLDCSTTGLKEHTVSATFGPGVFWAMTQIGSTGGVVTRSQSPDSWLTLGRGAGSTVNGDVQIAVARSDAALPSTLSETWVFGNNAPHGVQMRIA